jgi:hypothetical protein
MFYLNKTIMQIIREYDGNHQEYWRDTTIDIEVMYDCERERLRLNTISGVELFSHDEADILLSEAEEKLTLSGVSLNNIYFHIRHQTFLDIPADRMTPIEVLPNSTLRIGSTFVRLGGDNE